MQLSFGVVCLWPVYILRIAMISGSLTVSVKHILYRFTGSRLLWVLIYMGYSFGRWRLTLWTKNGKFTWSTAHGSPEGDQWYPSCKLLGTCLRSIFHRICLIFITHARLYHWCVKIWMLKMWWIFGRSSISPNFSSAKVSLHTVYPNACTNKLTSTTPTRFNPYFGWYKSIWAIATHQPK